MKRVLAVILAVCVALAAWVVWDNYADGVDTRDEAAAELARGQTSAATDATHTVSDRVAQGAYLARAGNCNHRTI